MIFDVEKWERIKNRREDAVQGYQAANEDWKFERGNFEKTAGVFEGNFRPSTPEYTEAAESIKRLRRMDPQDISAIDLKVKETLALAETGSSFHHHLAGLLTQLITVKRAEARKERAAEIQTNNIQCFGVLEAFARKHIKLPISSGPNPVADTPTAVDSYTEAYYD